jgi:hypothetical protein
MIVRCLLVELNDQIQCPKVDTLMFSPEYQIWKSRIDARKKSYLLKYKLFWWWENNTCNPFGLESTQEDTFDGFRIQFATIVLVYMDKN